MTSALAVASVLTVGAIGCGSSEETTPSDTAGTTAGSADRPGDAAAAERQTESSAEHPTGGIRPGEWQGEAEGAKGGSDDSKPAGDGRASPSKPSSGGKEEPQGLGENAGKGGRPSIQQVAAKNCPKGLDLARCKDLVKGSKQAQTAPSHVIEEPTDCVKAMGREACEALYAAQKQAAESAGEGVTYEECLRDRTPQCEAILGPILEQQNAASQEAAK